MPARLSTTLLLFAVAIITRPSAAEVLDAAGSGFTVRHQVTVPANRRDAWTAFVGDVGQWWNGDHTVTGDAANLFIDPRPMGCFCENLGDGGLVHMIVTFSKPGVMLRLTGGLGPLGLMGVNGNLTFEFADGDKSGTSVVTMQYAVGGYRPGGLDEIAPAVNDVLVEQLERYALHVRSLEDE